jgi:NADPH:quinone reductase-like Zn-dependent oxidoreductase
VKAFVLDRYGKGRALRSAEMPTPELRDDEVLVEVHAASVNQLDSKIRGGQFTLILPYRPPLILGHDVAGVVVRAGPRVRQFKLGDEVYARTDDFRIGTFAQFVPVKEASLALKLRALAVAWTSGATSAMRSRVRRVMGRHRAAAHSLARVGFTAES